MHCTGTEARHLVLLPCIACLGLHSSFEQIRNQATCPVPIVPNYSVPVPTHVFPQVPKVVPTYLVGTAQ